MDRFVRWTAVMALCLFGGTIANGQIDDFCAEFGATPSLNSPWANIPYVFGRITFRSSDAGAKFPRITITLVDPQQSQKRQTVERSGNYCFRRTANAGGTLIVEVDGVEAARRSISSFGPAHQREDFEIFPDQKIVPPAAISAKYAYPPNDKTIELYKKAAQAEAAKEPGLVIDFLKEIVAIDKADFIAWAKLGSLYFEQKNLADAEASFRRSLELKVEYVPAWINMGKIRMSQKQYETAIAIFKHASSLEPDSAWIYQMLGEAYLQNRQGTLGAEALNKALELDPVGMAECHLQLAHLYQLAKANRLAAAEYRKFLGKVPDHPDKKKFEKFIKENPE